MAEARVNRIVVPSFLDGPGSRMAIFLQGCDLACGHCHNPETWQVCGDCGQCVPGCPAGALELREGRVRHDLARCLACDRCLDACPNHASPRVTAMTVADLLAQVRPWVPYLDGLTFSGGECTLQWGFLEAFLPRLRSELGLGALLDSNGNLGEAVLEGLLPLAEGFLFDLKVLDDQRHRTLTGAGNERILRNLKRVAGAGKLTEVRTVLIPGVSADAATVLGVARLVEGLGPTVPLRLSPFRTHGVRGDWAAVPSLGREPFEALCRLAEGVLGDRLRLGNPTA